MATQLQQFANILIDSCTENRGLLFATIDLALERTDDAYILVKGMMHGKHNVVVQAVVEAEGFSILLDTSIPFEDKFPVMALRHLVTIDFSNPAHATTIGNMLYAALCRYAQDMDALDRMLNPKPPQPALPPETVKELTRKPVRLVKFLKAPSLNGVSKDARYFFKDEEGTVYTATQSFINEYEGKHKMMFAHPVYEGVMVYRKALTYNEHPDWWESIDMFGIPSNDATDTIWDAWVLMKIMDEDV